MWLVGCYQTSEGTTRYKKTPFWCSSGTEVFPHFKLKPLFCLAREKAFAVILHSVLKRQNIKGRVRFSRTVQAAPLKGSKETWLNRELAEVVTLLESASLRAHRTGWWVTRSRETEKVHTVDNLLHWSRTGELWFKGIVRPTMTFH